MTKKVLKDEELENVNGGYNFTFFDTTFDENTRVKTIIDKYPWIVSLYPDLETAAQFNLTVKSACSFGKISYEELQKVLREYEGKYDENGNPRL